MSDPLKKYYYFYYIKQMQYYYNTVFKILPGLISNQPMEC